MKHEKENPRLGNLIKELKKKSIDEKVKLWKRIASDLEKPSRQRRIVNLSRINRYTKENETIIVPGKVLGSGLLEHKLAIAAFDFSISAKEKIKSSGSEAISIEELMTKPVKGRRVRVIG